MKIGADKYSFFMAENNWSGRQSVDQVYTYSDSKAFQEAYLTCLKGFETFSCFNVSGSSIRQPSGRGVVVDSHWLTRWLTLGANMGVLIGIVLVLVELDQYR